MTLCSLDTLEREEPLLGTASRGRVHILLRWPKVRWAKKALTAPELAPLVEWHASKGPGFVLRLYAGEGSPDAAVARVFPAGLEVGPCPIDQLGTALDAAIEGTATRARPAKPTVAVCTHGKHDACCARFGQATFQALREEAPETYDVVEASHLGGHRFAATALELKAGTPTRMYGGLRPEDASHFFETATRNETWLERYRGRCDLSPAEQLAEVEALRAGAVSRIDIESRDSGLIVARWPEGQVEVEVELVEREGIKACGRALERWQHPQVKVSSLQSRRN